MSFYSDFAAYYEAIFPLEEEAYAFLRDRVPPGGRRVLDVGCGTGNYCGRFGSDGYEVVGIDLDSEMIEAAVRRFPGSSFLVMDMRDVSSLAGRFDLVYSVGNVLAHLPQSELPEFIDAVRRLLMPGGRWVFQTVNWDFILARKSHRFPDVVVGGLVFMREYPAIAWDRLRFVTRLARGTQCLFEGEEWLYPVTSESYVETHVERGWTLEEHRGSFVGAPFAASRMSPSIFVFQRAS